MNHSSQPRTRLELGCRPWYRAEANDDLTWFVETYGNPRTPHSDGSVESHVAAGKNTYVYDTHTYHTKVPPAAIVPFLEAHTHPGDLVLDPFAGSGMTGIAALETGRTPILVDLSPAATFITYNFLQLVDLDAWDQACRRMLERVGDLEARLYNTHCTICGLEHAAEYAVWSYRVRCPHCHADFNFWEVGRSIGATVRESRLRTVVECPNCQAEVQKGDLTRTVLEPVEIGYHCPTRRSRQEVMRPPTDTDVEMMRSLTIPPALWYPNDTLPMGVNTRQPMPYGIRSIRDFYTTRNLWAVAALWQSATEETDSVLRHKLFFAVTGLYLRVTKFSEFRFWGGSGNSPRLYVPMVMNEQNVFQALRRKMKHVRDHLETATYAHDAPFCVSTQSSTDLGSIPAASIDYIFTDPPFGANINYSEMNILWESWLGVRTDSTEEAIVNRFQAKGVDEYRDLLAKVFRECRRVLKPTGAMTVVFNNSNRRVWDAIVKSLALAGFSINESLTIDKKHATAKQLIARNTPGVDIAFECRIGDPDPTSGATLDMRPVVLASINDLPIGQRTDRMVFAHAVARLARDGLVPSVNFAEFRKWVRDEFPELIEEPQVPHYVRELARRNGSRAEQLPLI